MANDYTKSSLNKQPSKEDSRPTNQKVIKGKAKLKKKSEISKIAGNIIKGEAQSIKDYILYDVIIPNITDTVTALVKGTVDILFNGEVGRHTSYDNRRRSNGVTKVSYGSFYDDKRDNRRRDDRRYSEYYSYDDITFDYKDDALAVLECMDDVVEQYGVVRVSDMFEFAGYSGNGHTDQKYGWTTTKSATVERNRDGQWSIRIGRPSPIRNR